MDLCGTVTYDTVTVYDTGCAAAPVVDFVTTGGPLYGGVDTLNFTYTGTGVLDSMRWGFGDGGTATGATATHIYTAPPDSFNVCLAVYGPCGNDTLCRWVHTIPCTVPAASFAQSGTGAGRVYTYTGSTLYVDSIAWYMGDGGHATGNAASYSYAAAGSYTVCVIAYSKCGNDTSCSTVVITNVGVINTGTYKEQVYPNPVHEMLYVDGVLQTTGYRLLNITGIAVLHGDLPTGNNKIAVSALPQGIYFLELTGGDGARSMVRVVKE